MLNKVLMFESEAHGKDKSEGIHQGRTGIWVIFKVTEIDEVI